jgi:hypothetical protein
MSEKITPLKEENDRIAFDLPVSLKNAFKATVALQGKKVKDVLTVFVEEYVKENSHQYKSEKP